MFSPSRVLSGLPFWASEVASMVLRGVQYSEDDNLAAFDPVEQFIRKATSDNAPETAIIERPTFRVCFQ